MFADTPLRINFFYPISSVKLTHDVILLRPSIANTSVISGTVGSWSCIVMHKRFLSDKVVSRVEKLHGSIEPMSEWFMKPNDLLIEFHWVIMDVYLY